MATDGRVFDIVDAVQELTAEVKRLRAAVVRLADIGDFPVEDADDDHEIEGAEVTRGLARDAGC